ncbi:MAG: tRNA lysidine(34) synthetase TilS [Verrucomicrobia bacterium]|nr:MAG: tRNA lysidine(34) synthetase TilS [Verrucomicrobiota bacterium]
MCAMLACVHNNLRRYAMIQRGDLVVVAVSGGADSVALLHVLHRLHIKLAVAHLHHGIRGAAADADAAFVRRLAHRLGVPLIEERVDVPARAKADGISLEMAARVARYAFFARAAKQLGAAAVAVAHTADDQAETVLLRLARGAGSQGLGGMEPVSHRDGLKIIRPLLKIPRAALIAFLKEHRLRWREDATNCDPHFLRNRVRHEILPLLEKRLNPQIRTALLRTAEVLREENGLLDELTGRALFPNAPKDSTVSVKKLTAWPLALQRRALRLWLMHAGLPAEHLDFEAVEAALTLLKSTRGTRSVEIGDGWRVMRRYDQVAVENTAPAAAPQWELQIKSHRGVVKEKPTQPGQLPSHATLSAARVGKSPLVVRVARPGDRLAPFGLNGTKKLQDIFTDAKVPRDQRDQIPVVECRGEIVWLPGYRVARGWEVPTARSHSLLLTLRIS